MNSDAYLQPIIDIYGEHQGLNADWCTMAWRIRGDVWLLDDESTDRDAPTVSIVRQPEDPVSFDTVVETLFQGSVADALVAAKEYA